MGKAGAGFRKPRKKPFISKKDLIYTSIAVAVVVVVIAVLAVVISRDDFIRVRDGKLDMEDNWIIANYSNTSSARYYKIGELGNAKGFTLGAESANSSIKYLYPEDETSPITVAYVGTYSYNYEDIAQLMAESYTDVSAPEHIKCAGRDAVLLTSYTPAQDDAAQDADSAAPLQTEAPESVDADGEEAETSKEGLWVMIAYIDYDEDHCIYIHLNADAELTDDQTQGYLDAIGDALVIESR